jgi:hypothetical protein
MVSPLLLLYCYLFLWAYLLFLHSAGTGFAHSRLIPLLLGASGKTAIATLALQYTTVLQNLIYMYIRKKVQICIWILGINSLLIILVPC